MIVDNRNIAGKLSFCDGDESGLNCMRYDQSQDSNSIHYCSNDSKDDDEFLAAQQFLQDFRRSRALSCIPEEDGDEEDEECNRNIDSNGTKQTRGLTKSKLTKCPISLCCLSDLVHGDLNQQGDDQNVYMSGSGMDGLSPSTNSYQYTSNRTFDTKTPNYFSPLTRANLHDLTNEMCDDENSSSVASYQQSKGSGDETSWDFYEEAVDIEEQKFYRSRSSSTSNKRGGRARHAKSSRFHISSSSNRNPMTKAFRSNSPYTNSVVVHSPFGRVSHRRNHYHTLYASKSAAAFQANLLSLPSLLSSITISAPLTGAGATTSNATLWSESNGASARTSANIIHDRQRLPTSDSLEFSKDYYNFKLALRNQYNNFSILQCTSSSMSSPQSVMDFAM